MDELEIKGRKYISSKRASKITGYAKDYVGQLARGGKINATRVGRAWYVSEDEILTHAGITASEDVATPGDVSVEEKLTPRKETLYSLNKLKASTPALAPKLLKTWSEVTYHYDESPLLPERIATVDTVKSIRIIKADTVTPTLSQKITTAEKKPTISIVKVHAHNKSSLASPAPAIDGMTLAPSRETVSSTIALRKNKKHTTLPKAPKQSANRFPVVYTLAITGSALALLFVILSGNVVTMEWGVGAQTASAGSVISGPETLGDYFIGIFTTALDLLKGFFSILFNSFWIFVEDGLLFIINLF